jgi:protein gp37
MRIAARLARMGGKTGSRYAGLTQMERSGPRWSGEMRIAEDLLGWPLYQSRARRIGVNTMSDLFHEHLDTATVDLVHAVMATARWHRFLVLTKRSARMRAYYSDPGTPSRIAERVEALPSILPRLAGRRRAPPHSRELAIRPTVRGLWPMPNLWLGVSVEDHAQTARVRDLIDMPAAFRWVCFEPLLGGVRPDLIPWESLGWVVAGGEIGAGARPTQLQWMRELRDECIARNIPFYFRQWGEWAPTSSENAPPMLRVGKRAAGRLLDGRSWDEIPSEGD